MKRSQVWQGEELKKRDITGITSAFKIPLRYHVNSFGYKVTKYKEQDKELAQGQLGYWENVRNVQVLGTRNTLTSNISIVEKIEAGQMHNLLNNAEQETFAC